MTYGEFKARLKYILAGGMDMASNDEAISTFLQSALDEIISTVEPLKLITQDKSLYSPIRYIDDVYFIRKYKMPIEDADEIDIDQKLAEAALDLVAYYMSNRDIQKQSEIHLTNAAVKQDEYNLSKYAYIENIEFYENGTSRSFKPNRQERWDIPTLLDAWGLLKYYVVVERPGTKEYRYLWDGSTVFTVDIYMLDNKANMLTESMQALWKQFCDYEDSTYTIGPNGEPVEPIGSEDPEKYALAVLDEIYLQAATKGDVDESLFYAGQSYRRTCPRKKSL